MILAVDMGNSNIVIGCLEETKILFSESISTDMIRTELEYAVIFNTMTTLYGFCADTVTGAIIASEVPSLTDTLIRAIRKFFNVEAMVVGPGVKNGLNMRMDNPAQVGAGVIVNAVAGIKEYGSPLITIDMSTATTISVIDNNSIFVGGMIMPGAMISLEALVGSTSQLPKIGLEPSKSIIGKNTIDSMKSGLVYGQAASIDGMIEHIYKELGYETKIVATGSIAEQIVPYCSHDIIFDEKLPLKGLGLIYYKNRG